MKRINKEYLLRVFVWSIFLVLTLAAMIFVIYFGCKLFMVAINWLCNI